MNLRETIKGSDDWSNEDFYIPKLASDVLSERWENRDQNEDDELYRFADVARTIARSMTRYASDPAQGSFDITSRVKIVDRTGLTLTAESLGFDIKRFIGPTTAWDAGKNPDRIKACAELTVGLLEGLCEGKYEIAQ